jgi:hypothetical protein
MVDQGNAVLAVDLDHLIHGHDGPGRMELSQQERSRAIRIKEAIASTEGIAPVTDFMCAQLALMDGDNTEAAVHRVEHLQCFKEEYGLLDTLEDGRKCFEDYIAMQPRKILNFNFCNETGQYTLICDNAKLDASQLNSEEGACVWVGGVYYLCQIFCPDFSAIRRGATIIYENEG